MNNDDILHLVSFEVYCEGIFTIKKRAIYGPLIS